MDTGRGGSCLCRPGRRRNHAGKREFDSSALASPCSCRSAGLAEPIGGQVTGDDGRERWGRTVSPARDGEAVQSRQAHGNRSEPEGAPTSSRLLPAAGGGGSAKGR